MRYSFFLSLFFFSICVGSNRRMVVEDILKKYSRSVTLFDISASYEFDMYFAQQFDTVCVLGNVKEKSDCLHYFQQHDDKGNIIVLGDVSSREDVRRLGECEHFDIILAFDFISSHGDDWKYFFDELLFYGNYLFISVPLEEKHIYSECFKKQKGILVSEDSKELIFLFFRENSRLRRTNWQQNTGGRNCYNIESSFAEKKLIKTKKQYPEPVVTHWYPGINLCTFRKLQGIYPLKSTIFEMLKPFEFIQHNDLFDYNIIIQGYSLIPIDGDDPRLMDNPQGGIEKLLNQFRLIRYFEF